MVRRIIFSYWDQGIASAPPVVRMCAQRMQQLHPQWEIRILDRESAASELDEIPVCKTKFSSLKKPHQSDLLRTHLLIKYGGVWADPTVFFAQTLDGWIDQMTRSGFFIFTNPGRDRLISNWFIASEANNPLLVELYARLCAYWNDNEFRNVNRRPGKLDRVLSRLINRNLARPRLWLRWPIRRVLRLTPYMIYHYQFYDLICRDPNCRNIWDKAGKLPASGPVSLLRHGLLNPASAKATALVEEPAAPLFKLTWKLPDSEIPAGSVLDYLFGLSRSPFSANKAAI